MLAIIGNINIDNSSTCARVSGRQEQCKTAINSVPIKGFCTYKGKYPNLGPFLPWVASGLSTAG